jgi:hypothetical protein
MSDEELFRQIDDAFNNTPVFEITVKGVDHTFRITSMGELSTEKLLDFLLQEGEDKFTKMLDFIAMSLIEPKDIELLKQMKMKQALKFIEQWVELSSEETWKSLGRDDA